MNDWRTILKAPGSYSQNPQKRVSGVHFEDFGDIKDQLPKADVTMLGAAIFWQRADLTRHSAVVESLHTDANGTTWAFVTLSDGWALVNMKYARTVSTRFRTGTLPPAS